jgi:hypothetical protein
MYNLDMRSMRGYKIERRFSAMIVGSILSY